MERVDTDGVTVIAGEANEITTGKEIRDLGEHQPQHGSTSEDPD